MKYRAEIDGLRALAVLPVILFHAGFDKFSGGFVGVDVFFVISGYLITSIIFLERIQGTFSLARFYERRARRILPPLFLVMFVTLPFAWFWLFPSDLHDFFKSLVAVSTFSSNVLFWQETGYWGIENELKPFLHTWSLAVEEQYYVLFPLFIMVMWQFRKRWILVSFIMIALISLTASQWAAYNEPTANFFLLPTRAWELAIGASIALYSLYKKKLNFTFWAHKLTNEVFAVLGLVCIGYSAFTFSKDTPYPSLYTLVPTLGTGLIIQFSSKDTIVGKLLGSKILVSIGLISYSSYLWHQPLFAFARHRSLTEPSELLFVILTLVSLSLAYFSWKYVENPFRSKNKISSKTIILLGTSASVFFLAIGIVGQNTYGLNGLLLRNKLTQENIDIKLGPNYGLDKKCQYFSLLAECKTSDAPEILIWGDSFAMHLVQGILASNPDAKIIQMTKSLCGPFGDIAPVTARNPVNWAQECLDFSDTVREWIKSNTSVRFVVLSSPFGQYLRRSNKLLSRNGSLKPANVNYVTNEFLKTLDELKSLGVTPVVISPPPNNGVNLGRCLAKAEWNGLNLDVCDFDVRNISKIRKDVYHFLEEIQKKHRVIRLDEIICNEERCRTHFDSIWLYRDKAHLSKEGSAELGKRFDLYNKIVQEKQ